MIIVFAMVLMMVPLVVLYVCEQAAKNGRGPLAEPGRMTVLDGQVVPAPATAPVPARPVPAGPATPDPVFTDPGDTGRCAAESRLVRQLLAGTLERPRYHAEMAALAAGTGSPVQMPADPD
jgi:hypothetical protein